MPPNIALSKGINFVYTGNVHDRSSASTYCSQCKKVLIERDWFQLGEYHLKNKNQCEFCGTVCSGHFDKKPGNWPTGCFILNTAENCDSSRVKYNTPRFLNTEIAEYKTKLEF